MLCSQHQQQQQQHSPSSEQADSGGGTQAAFPCPDKNGSMQQQQQQPQDQSPLTCQEEMLPTCMSTAGTAWHSHLGRPQRFKQHCHARSWISKKQQHCVDNGMPRPAGAANTALPHLLGPTTLSAAGVLLQQVLR